MASLATYEAVSYTHLSGQALNGSRGEVPRAPEAPCPRDDLGCPIFAFKRPAALFLVEC